jgi:HK97 family phage prohead protease
MHDRLAIPVELKLAGPEAAPGSFEGYASLFGVIDQGGDMVAPGAFTQSLAAMKARGYAVPMYLNHGAMAGSDPLPVGVWRSITEDAKGLSVSGELLGLNTDAGAYRYELVKGGAMRGLSIGYRAKKVDYGKKPGEPRRTLKQIDLIEISIVDDPMLAQAQVATIKSAAAGFTIREFERALESGTLPPLSDREAKALLAGGFKALDAIRGEARDALTPDPSDPDSEETLAALRGLLTRMKG